MPKKKASAQHVQIAVIYARYSSHNQREESIEQQIACCTDFARENNLSVSEVYADKAITGKTDRRLQFQRMLRDAEKGKFTAVIAYKSNRIARNMMNALQYEARLASYGIKTYYAAEEFDDTAAGRFALRSMMNVNQFYSENMAEDIKRGLMDNAMSCKVNGSLPLGYVKGPEGEYQIEPGEAKTVREIFSRVLSGEMQVDIINDLNRRGIKTKRKGSWTKSSFRAILRNDNYIGVYRYSGIVQPGGIPAIVPKEVFAAMQEKLKQHHVHQRRHQEAGDYLLTGKLRCGLCGGWMVGCSGTSHAGETYYYYSCQTKRVSHSCSKKNVRRDLIEYAVAEYTKKYVLQDDVIEWIAQNAVEFQKAAMCSDDLKLIEMDLAEKKTAQKNVMAAIEAGIITASTKDRLLELESEISNLEMSLSLQRARVVPVEKEEIIYALERYRDGDLDNPNYRKKLIDSFVKEVWLFDDKIKIDYYYAGKNSSVTIAMENLEDTNGAAESSPKLCLSPPQQTQSNPVIFLTEYGFSLVAPFSAD